MRLRSFLLGLVIGVAVLGLSASPAKAQSTTWHGASCGDNINWTDSLNWIGPITFPGDSNGGASEGQRTTHGRVRTGFTPPAAGVGINFSGYR